MSSYGTFGESPLSTHSQEDESDDIERGPSLYLNQEEFLNLWPYELINYCLHEFSYFHSGWERETRETVVVAEFENSSDEDYQASETLSQQSIEIEPLQESQEEHLIALLIYLLIVFSIVFFSLVAMITIVSLVLYANVSHPERLVTVELLIHWKPHYFPR